MIEIDTTDHRMSIRRGAWDEALGALRGLILLLVRRPRMKTMK